MLCLGAFAHAGEAYSIIGRIVALYSKIRHLELTPFAFSIMRPFILPNILFSIFLICAAQVRLSFNSTPRKVDDFDGFRITSCCLRWWWLFSLFLVNNMKFVLIFQRLHHMSSELRAFCSLKVAALQFLPLVYIAISSAYWETFAFETSGLLT